MCLPSFRGDWVCTLCRDVLQPDVEYNGDNERASGENASANLLSPCDQKVGQFIRTNLFTAVNLICYRG